jgi:CHAT domain-containing protein
MNAQEQYAIGDVNKLYRLLLSDGLNSVSDKIDHLLLIPDGIIYWISFASLIKDDGEYLIEKYRILQNYSTSLLFDEIEPNTFEYDFAGFGTSYSEQLNQKIHQLAYIDRTTQLLPLNKAEREIEESASIFEGESFIGKEANIDNFIKFSPRAKIIYLSLHGLVNHVDASRSCIVFDDRNPNFILSPATLFALDLRSELIILSSCHTASGQLYRGEGLNGMTRSFISSGAKNVVASLWSATEESSFTILPELLRYFEKGLPIDLALKKSVRHYLKQVSPALKHPYYWANYIIVGKISSNHNNHLKLISTILVFAAFTFLILLLLRRYKYS